MIRVGFATPGLGLGGAERWVVTLARHLRRDRIEVTGIMGWQSSGDALVPEASRICPLYSPNMSPVFLRSCDTVIAWGFPDIYNYIPQSWGGRMIVVSHGTGRQHYHVMTAERMESRPGVILTGVSDDANSLWSRPSITIPNGVEVDRITPREGREATRRWLDIPADAQVAVQLARFSPEKRQKLFAAAVVSTPGMYGIMAGGDYCGHAAQLEPHPRLRIIPGGVSHPGDLLAASDVLALPSDAEAHPLALTEAWLAGVPTVYGDWPFAGQMRRAHGSDLGFIIPVEPTEGELAHQLRRACAYGRRRAWRAREVAWVHYTASAMAARWEALLGATGGPQLAEIGMDSCGYIKTPRTASPAGGHFGMGHYRGEPTSAQTPQAAE